MIIRKAAFPATTWLTLLFNTGNKDYQASFKCVTARVNSENELDVERCATDQDKD